MAEYDLVLSYAVEDEGWARKLADALKNEDVRVLNDPKGLAPSRQLQAWMSGDASEDCKLIAVCSPHYFRDPQVAFLLEDFSRENSAHLRIQRPLLPVLPPGSPPPPVPGNIALLDFSNEEDFDLRLRQLVEALEVAPRETVVERGLRTLLGWVGWEKSGQEFKELIAELYRLFGFEVKSNEEIREIKDLKIDLLVEKQSGGFPFRMIVECSKAEPSGQQIELLFAKHRLVQNRLPGTGCLLVTAQELSAEMRTVLERGGIRGTTYPELLNSLLPMNRYVEKLCADFEKWRAENWDGEDWFIRQDVLTDWERLRHPAWRQVSAWLGDNGNHLLALLGDLGTGKTTLAGFLAYEMAKAYRADPLRHPAPVLIKLLNVRKDVSLESIVITHFSDRLEKREMDDFSFPRFEYLLRRGRIVLLFDAFDEMAERVRPQVMRSNLKELIRPTEQGGKVLLTCRTHYFKNRAEQEGLLGKGAVYLQEFSDDQVQNYLAKARPQTKEQDWRRIQEIYNLKELVQRPLLLDMVVRAMPTARSVNAASLYAEYARLWFDREQKKGRLLNKQVKISLMMELAWQIWHEEKNAIHFDYLLQLVEDLRGRKALDFGAELTEDIAEEMRTASFLHRDDEGNYSFADLSFEEYFLACRIYDYLKRPDSPDRIKEVLRTRRFKSKVIFFLEKLITGDGANYGPIREILEEGYEPQVTENALQILYWSERIRLGMEEEITDPEKMRQAFSRHIPRKACLSGARLREIVLEAADLSEADFSGADLTQANLNQARLQQASFRGATLTGASLEHILAVGADFREAQLSQAVFKHGMLANTDFTGVLNRETVFDDNDLRGARGLNAAGSLRKSGLRPAVQQTLSAGLHVLSFDLGNGLCASGGQDGLIAISRIQDGRLLHVLEGHRGRVLSLQFSPSGTLLVSGGMDGAVSLWSVSEGQLLNGHQEHKGRVNTVQFSPSGRLVASGGDDKIVRLWSVDNDRISYLEGFQGHLANISALHFSFDGGMLASGSDNGSVRLWDVNTGFLIRVIRSEDEAHTVINTLQFSPDARILATGSSDRLVRLWLVHQGDLFRTLERHEGDVTSLNFSPDGQLLASGGKDRCICLWLVADRVSFKLGDQVLARLESEDLPGEIKKQLLRLKEWKIGEEDAFRGLLASLVRDVMARLVQMKNQEVIGEEQFLSLLNNKLGDVLTPDFISSILKLAAVGPLLQTEGGHEDLVDVVRFSADGRQLVSGSTDRQMRLWAVRDERLESAGGIHIPGSVKRHAGVKSVCIGSNGQMIVSGGQDTWVYIWQGRESGLRQALIGHTDSVRAVDVSADGQLIASGSDDRTIRIWSAPAGRPVHVFEGHKGRVTSVQFSSKDSLLVSGSEDKTIGLWLVTTGRLANLLRGHTGAVNTVQFSPDGSLLASGSEDKSVWLWSAPKGQTPKVRSKLDGHDAGVQAVQFSPNGVYLASAGKDRSVRLWLVDSGRVRHVLDGHADAVGALRFFPDSSRVASGSEDGSVCIWNVADGSPQQTLTAHLGKVHGIDISRDGRFLIAAGSAGRLQYWDLETGKTVLYRYAFDPDAWLDLLPDGRFNASAEGRRYLYYTELGVLNSHAAEIVMEDFHDPGGVREVLERLDSEDFSDRPDTPFPKFPLISLRG